MKSEIMKKWKDMTLEEQQGVGLMVGVTAGLFVRGLLKRGAKRSMETVNIVVPKDCELFIFVKGGK